MNKYQYKDIKEPNKILELKSTVADMKNSLWGFNSFRFKLAGEKWVNWKRELLKSCEYQKEKMVRKNKQSLRTHRTPTNRPTYTLWSYRKRREWKVAKNNGWKLSKFIKRHESTHPRSRATQTEQTQRDQTKSLYNQSDKRQRIYWKTAQEKWLIMYKGSSIRLTADLSPKVMESEDWGGIKC